MNKRIKMAYTCAGVPGQINWHYELPDAHIPWIGDVGLFRVMDSDGKYMKTRDGGTCSLFTDDLIMAAYGARYATNQYEAYLPQLPTRHVELVGRGGVVAQVASKNHTHPGQAIPLELLAFAVDAQGAVINTLQALTPFRGDTQGAKVLLSVGSSMDSGKTTTAAHLCGGLGRVGYKTAYIKLTGTAYPKDTIYCYDRGADYVTDFSQRGFTSTFQVGTPTLLSLYQELLDECVRQVKPDYIVVEIADGILQQETRELLQNSEFMHTVGGVVLSCGDSLGVLSGIEILKSWGIAPVLISGLFTASQLLMEEVRPLTKHPIFSIQELLAGNMLPLLAQQIPTPHVNGVPASANVLLEQFGLNGVGVLRA
ncbi:hypothetical protein QWY85_12410 [Neolewinella lacunae]|uniref:DUF1611 domain-containing protein n=1 Tax=Neolewinella lacunae TaxID=1517758 RepID=A0A923PPR4_9BACT|nr:hypothetical protein [Neolewinella lacunae]MBC6995224.1 hypothetical protein [Neolewinella lacunae]MDN3635467.1 hypothetical protein [Neolewinella lacunae]